MDISGGTAAAQMKLMGLLAELNAAGEVKMKFSHSLLHLRVRKQPQDVEGLATHMHEVFEQHVQAGVDRIDAVMAMATSRKCIAASLLQHFGEKLSEPCGSCSSCLGEKRLRKLPMTAVYDVTQDELELVQVIASERKPALASPERLARFLCGIYSPGMMRYRLYQRAHWGMLQRLPYGEVLAYTKAQIY